MSSSIKINAKYLFVRDDSSASGILSRNRASTDALNALQEWISVAGGREYSIGSDADADTDHQLVATLTLQQSDTSAGHDLQKCCTKFGVKWEFKPEDL